MATTSFSPAQLGTPAAAADRTQGGLGSFAVKLVTLYAFFLSSRSFEILTQISGRDLYIMLLLSALGLSIVFAKGTFAQAAKSPAGMILLAFTGWAMLVLPFSSWKSQSLHELTSVWFKSLAAYFIIVGLCTSFEIAKKIYVAVGLGAVTSTLLMYKFGWFDEGRLSGFGSLANSNEVAFHLVVGLPFIFLLMSRSKTVWKIALGAIVLLALSLSLKTASRSGLIMLAVIFAVSFIRVSGGTKFKMIVVGVIGAIVALSSITQDQMDRYSTLFSHDDTSAAAQSARLSGEERRRKLDEAIELTFMHPIFGVGMGAFIPSSVALAESKGEKGAWIAPHNSYAEVSSEMGFVGLILFVAVLGSCFRGLIKLDRTAKRLNLPEVRSMALCMLLALCVMSIHFTFDAISYQFYLPMMAALATALIINAEPMVRAAEARAAGNALPEASPGSNDNTRSPRLLSGPVQGGHAPISRSHNAYRFGRRRDGS